MSQRGVRPDSGGATLAALRQRAVRLADALPAHAAFSTLSGPALRRGAHGRRRAGGGDSFWQFRGYQPGEPAARIDWRRSARADMLYVREREWDSAQDVWIWVDRAPGMDFRSPAASENKRDRALLLALAMAHLAMTAGERIGLYGQHDRAAAGSYGMDRLLAGLESAGPDDADGGLPDAAAPLGRGHLILLGDFLGRDPDRTRAHLDRLLGRGVTGHMLQILDPAEEDFPYRGRVMFNSPAAGDTLLVDRADSMAEAYRRQLAAWRDELSGKARHAGWSFSRHRTDRSAAPALAALVARTGRTA